MTILAHGFADPVMEAQQVFHAAMNALARPGHVEHLRTGLTPPPPLTPELAAVALTLADHEAPIWLDPDLAAEPGVAEFLRFHTGAAVVAEPDRAAFALIADPRKPLSIEQFALGTAEFPDRSTTLVIAVSDLSDLDGWVLRGPGIAERQNLRTSPRPHDLADIIRLNAASFPRGLDVLLVAPGRITGLPRSARLVEET